MANFGVSGNLQGLKSLQIKRLKKLAGRRFPADSIVAPEFARALCEISFEIHRQIGVLVDRQGYIVSFFVGDSSSVLLPDLKRQRIGEKRLRGLRLVHTHLNKETLTDDDLTDLILLRLDMVSAICISHKGLPENIYSAHINPDLRSSESFVHLPIVHPSALDNNFAEIISELENEFALGRKDSKKHKAVGRAILIGVALKTKSNFKNNSNVSSIAGSVKSGNQNNLASQNKNIATRSIDDSLMELKELCKTAGLDIICDFKQSVSKLNPKTLIGKGKLKEIIFHSIRHDCDMLIFDRELAPAQAKNICDFTDLKVVDRTQLILDIFAANATSRDGKLQVELAQLQYLKSRLSEKDDNMSRLTGGIGGRGPGETKLEIGNRRVSDRIALLQKQLKTIKKRRNINRRHRTRTGIPLGAIVGYTNAGKSTLLNKLTNSNVFVKDKLFATLDPTTRRIRFPEEKEMILADTVGFIHDLPDQLVNAFKATLEELQDAHLLLQVVDVSHQNFLAHIDAVNRILKELDLRYYNKLLVFNKIDKLDEETLELFKQKYPDAVFVSAVSNINLELLITNIQSLLSHNTGF